MTKKLKVLIYGEDIGWAMGPNLVNSFNKLGHNAALFDYTKYFYRATSPSITNKILDRLLVSSISNKINKKFIAEIEKTRYNLLIVLKGANLSPETLARVKSKVDYMVNWDPDDFNNPISSSKYVVDSINIYDVIFSPREHLFEEYLNKGVQSVVSLDWYCMPNIQKKLSLSSNEINKYGSDVVFVANWSPRREEYVYGLRSLNIRVWGQGWYKSGKAFKKSIEIMPPIYFPEMSKVVSASKININMLTLENRDTSNFRNYEVPACGAFQLSERSKKINSIFQEGKNIACFSSSHELKDKCNYYLKNNSERREIANESYEMILNSQNTIDERVMSIIKTFY
jgi:spore maturation protein CgeB